MYYMCDVKYLPTVAGLDLQTESNTRLSCKKDGVGKGFHC